MSTAPAKVSAATWRRLEDDDPVARAFTDRCQIDVGRAIVLITPDEATVWLSHWPDAMRVLDRMDAWRCSIFRNDSPALTPELIRMAMTFTSQIWRGRPTDGWITWVDRRRSCTPNPASSFTYAGWWRDESFTHPHLIRLRASAPPPAPHRRAHPRGGRAA